MGHQHGSCSGHLLPTSDVPAQVQPESPGLRGLGLHKIMSQAKSQKSGLAWPGFGWGQGFGRSMVDMHDFADFHLKSIVIDLIYV